VARILGSSEVRPRWVSSQAGVTSAASMKLCITNVMGRIRWRATARSPPARRTARLAQATAIDTTRGWRAATRTSFATRTGTGLPVKLTWPK